MGASLRWLRPYLHTQLQPRSRAASSTYLRFYNAIRSYSAEPGLPMVPRIRTGSEDPELLYKPEAYPRIASNKGVVDYATLREWHKNLIRGESKGEEVVVRGRVWSFRIAGSKLVFIDLFQNAKLTSLNTNNRLQCIVNFSKVESSEVPPQRFKYFLQSLHRGDTFSIKGIPHRTERNEFSILATELPQLLSRCTQELPEDVRDKQTLMRNRHVDILLNPRPSDIIRLRAEITRFLRQYLQDDGHIEVQTPILADTAGGAVARPFVTRATEFADRQLALRIAPELWLKRLILGGFEKVFEIGPSFRNEGIDLNHNPEFTTCEFYKTYATLDDLIKMTETMFTRLARVIDDLLHTTCRSLEPPKTKFSPPFQRLDFIPAIEAKLDCKLPSLSSPEAQTGLLQIFSQKAIPIPSVPNVPRLLDKLSSAYLEPQCLSPTWITNHPECLSPLSKSFIHPSNQQIVAARAELFINAQEFVNTYEEENSPIEQRRKFKDQIHNHQGDPNAGIDESYLKALEWGLPPTGGWGCGIDRLCMLFSGSQRIADVLPFGTLRNVVSLRQSSREIPPHPAKKDQGPTEGDAGNLFRPAY